jgi:hypothetical protein
MSDPSLPLQIAIVAALKAADVAGDRVYDTVPPGAEFPYVSISGSQVLPDKADCIDGTEVFVQLDAWSRAQGYPEVMGIAGGVVDALDDEPIVVDGFHLVVLELQNLSYLRDPDGLTRHAAISFRALLQPV